MDIKSYSSKTMIDIKEFFPEFMDEFHSPENTTKEKALLLITSPIMVPTVILLIIIGCKSDMAEIIGLFFSIFMCFMLLLALTVQYGPLLLNAANTYVNW